MEALAGMKGTYIPVGYFPTTRLVTLMIITLLLQIFFMSRATFGTLVQLVRDGMAPAETPAATVPVEKRVAIGLWTMATTSEMRSMVCIFGVGTSTVHKFFKTFVT